MVQLYSCVIQLYSCVMVQLYSHCILRAAFLVFESSDAEYSLEGVTHLTAPFERDLEVLQKKGHPQMIHFNRIFHDKSSILGFLFWKHPYQFDFWWLHGASFGARNLWSGVLLGRRNKFNNPIWKRFRGVSKKKRHPQMINFSRIFHDVSSILSFFGKRPDPFDFWWWIQPQFGRRDLADNMQGLTLRVWKAWPFLTACNMDLTIVPSSGIIWKQWKLRKFRYHLHGFGWFWRDFFGFRSSWKTGPGV